MGRDGQISSTVRNSSIRDLNLFCLASQVDIIPAYGRSGDNTIADGLTRRSGHGVGNWETQEAMVRAMQLASGGRIWHCPTKLHPYIRLFPVLSPWRLQFYNFA